MKVSLLDVHERATTTTSTTHCISNLNDVIYHLCFPVFLLCQFHHVLSMQDDHIPSPSVSAFMLDGYIFFFGVTGFLYHQAYRMENFNTGTSILFYLPEILTNIALALIFVHRADLALTVVLVGTCSLCFITSIMTISRLLSSYMTECDTMVENNDDDDDDDDDDQELISSYQALQIV